MSGSEPDVYPRRLVMIGMAECDFCEDPETDLSYPTMTPMTQIRMSGIPSEERCGWQVCRRESCREACRLSQHLYSQSAEEAQLMLYQHQILETPESIYAWVIRSRTMLREWWRWEPHPITRHRPLFLMRHRDGAMEKLVSLSELIAARPERDPDWQQELQLFCHVSLLPELYSLVSSYT